MSGSEIAALAFGLTLILVTASVVLLRPIARQLTELVTASTRGWPADDATDLHRLRDQVAESDRRLAAVEERLSWHERATCDAVSHGDRVAAPLPTGRVSSAQDRRS